MQEINDERADFYWSERQTPRPSMQAQASSAMQSPRGGFIIESTEGERKGFASPEMVSLNKPICFSKLQGMR